MTQPSATTTASRKLASAAVLSPRTTGWARALPPFFRYPYLSYSPATVAYLQSRYVAQFAVT